jgi:hypothetical protein
VDIATVPDQEMKMKPWSRLQIARAPSVLTRLGAVCVATVVLVALGDSPARAHGGQPGVKGIDNSSLIGEP